MKPRKLTKADKILLYLLEMMEQGRTKLPYEDIVVDLFKKYPNDFHLRGYPQYPDSGGTIDKRLSVYKQKGYVVASNHVFSITDMGAEFARQISGSEDVDSSDRLHRSTQVEISRIKGLEGFHLFAAGKIEKLSDQDFYNYLGVSVRTQKSAFMGRLQTMISVVGDLQTRLASDPQYEKIIAYHEHLISKHENIVEFFKNG